MRLALHFDGVVLAFLLSVGCGRVRVSEVGAGLERELQLRCPKGEKSCDRVARDKCDGEYHVLREAPLPDTEDGVLWKIECGVHEIARLPREDEVAETPSRQDSKASTAHVAQDGVDGRDQRVRSARSPQAARPTAPPPPPPSTLSYGTCFAVSKDGYVLTAQHVVAGAAELKVHFREIGSGDARIVAQSVANDWALLKVALATPTFLPVASTKAVDSGTPVFTFGYPVIDLLGLEAKYTEGAISALSGLGGESSEMQIQVPIQRGNSGGPLLTSKGEVIGIVVSTVAVKRFAELTGSLPQNINFAVKSDTFSASLPSDPGRPPRVGTPTEIRSRARAATCVVTALQ